MPMQLKLVVNGVISPNSPRDTVAPMENTYSYLQIHLIKNSCLYQKSAYKFVLCVVQEIDHICMLSGIFSQVQNFTKMLYSP